MDAVYGPIFRYFDVLETISTSGFFTDTPQVSHWRRSLQARPSTQTAVAADYPEQLLTFLKNRNSHLSTLVIA